MIAPLSSFWASSMSTTSSLDRALWVDRLGEAVEHAAHHVGLVSLDITDAFHKQSPMV